MTRAAGNGRGVGMMAGPGLAIAVPAALAAGAAYAVSTVLQQQAARRAPVADTLRPRLLVDLLRQRLWLAGVGVAVLSFALQAVALAFGPLALVQPLIVTDLLVALPLAARLAGVRLGRREWLGMLAVAGGLVLFLVAAGPSSGRDDPDGETWLLASAVVAGLVLTLAMLGAGSTGIRRTSLLGAAAGVAFGYMAALVKTVTHLMGGGLLVAVTSWQSWAMAATAVIATLLAQSAFQSGALAVALPLIDVLEPGVAVLLGATAFGEHLVHGPGWLAAEALGAVLVIAGIGSLDRSPIVIAAQERVAAAQELAAEEPAAVARRGPRPPDQRTDAPGDLSRAAS